MKKKELKGYASLLIHTGIHLQKGQCVVITASLEQETLVSYLVKEAYEGGAKNVQVEWTSEGIDRLTYQYETKEELGKVTPWQEAKLKWMSKELPCRIHLISQDPYGMKGLDQEKIKDSKVLRYEKTKKYADAMEGRYQWVIAAAPSVAWAKRVFPSLSEKKGKEALWQAILQGVRMNPGKKSQEPSSGKVNKIWDKRDRYFTEKCKELNEQKFKWLEYSGGNGTKLKVELIPAAMWMGGGEYTAQGIFFHPNLPTEEIYTTPRAGKAEGIVYGSKPLSFQGTLIEDFSITFQGGKAVAWEAKKGKEALGALLTADAGSCRLGEVALVPKNSPIQESGILFYETLFDENASCHLALGRGFANVLPGYETMTPEQWKKKGINESLYHVDFMIGTEDLSIDGIKSNGEKVPIFRKGTWAK